MADAIRVKFMTDFFRQSGLIFCEAVFPKRLALKVAMSIRTVYWYGEAKVITRWSFELGASRWPDIGIFPGERVERWLREEADYGPLEAAVFVRELELRFLDFETQARDSLEQMFKGADFKKLTKTSRKKFHALGRQHSGKMFP